MTSLKNKYKLKGHGSFIIREGWLNKALYYVNSDPMIFRNKKAADMLGVGNNMAQSIRYWLKACGLIEEKAISGARLTTIGETIFNKDPYFEDIFTLWILHYNLVINKEMATVWYLFFNKCDAEENSREEIERQVEKQLIKLTKDSNFSESSLKADIAALTNMYAKEKEDNFDPEDNRICPFNMLGLLKEKNHGYTKCQPSLELLDNLVILYALIIQMNGEKTISIDKVVEGDNSVGKIFNLSRVYVNQYLDKLEASGYIRVIRTSGLDTIYRIIEKKPNEIIEQYYLNNSN